jgi:alkanesulfonate monooxygenase SsuD/methylene tetrahydromethanopterin reductase-like flavin-dependent oxidoreductase (luciferase family)
MCDRPVDLPSPTPESLSGYPGGSLSEVYKIVFGPILALTFAAAHTSQVTLGTSVLVMPYRNPFVLAKSLATLDVLSGGRVPGVYGPLGLVQG